MPEDVETVEAPTESPTGEPESTTTETLAPVTDEPGSSPDGVKPDAVPAEPVTFDPEMEQTIEFNGKTYSLKGGELEKLLDKATYLSEKEKNLNRDYTQKTQGLAEHRKSIEQAFGRMLEKEEFQNLGKVYKAYFENPKIREILDSVIQGRESVMNGEPESNDPQSRLASGLRQEISALKNQLSQFISGTEQEKSENAEREGRRIFDSWRESAKVNGKQISEEQVDAILQWAGFLRQTNPNMDSSKALDEAYRHVNIDNLQKDAVGKVLKKADDTKKKVSIKITPKTPSKPEAQSYADIFKDAM